MVSGGAILKSENKKLLLNFKFVNLKNGTFACPSRVSVVVRPRASRLIESFFDMIIINSEMTKNMFCDFDNIVKCE